MRINKIIKENGRINTNLWNTKHFLSVCINVWKE